MAGRRAPRRQLRYELRGGLRALNAGRRGVSRRLGLTEAQAATRRRRAATSLLRECSNTAAESASGDCCGCSRNAAADDGVRLRAGSGAQPAAAAAIRASGFDVCCHGWRWVKHFELTEAEEREHIRKAVASLQTTVGGRALGLVLPLRARREHAPPDRRGGRLPLRLRLLWRRAALLETVNGRPHLVVPYSLTNNDGKYAGWVGTRMIGSPSSAMPSICSTRKARRHRR